MASTQPPNQVEAMHTRMLRLHFDLTGAGAGQGPALDETFEAFGVTLEELRVAEENLLHTNEVLLTTRHQLETERRRYRELFDLAPGSYLITDPDGVMIDANRAAAALLKVPQRFMAGKVLAGFVSEPDRRAFRAALVDLQRGLPSAPWRVRLRPRHSDLVDVEVSVSPGANIGRRGRELLWLLHDQNGLDRSAPVPGDGDELVASIAADRDRLRDLIDSVAVVVWKVDPVTGRLKFVSREIERLLGRPAGAWLDTPGGWVGHVHPDDRPVVDALHSRQRIDGTDLELEYRLIAPDGHAIWVREVSRFAPGRDSEPEALCGVLINVNKRKRVERKLYFARTEAETEVRELELLQDLCERLSRSIELPDVLDEIVLAVSSVLGADTGTVSLYDPARDEVRVAAGAGLPADFLAFLAAGRPGDVPWSRLPADCRALSIEDVESDPACASARDVCLRSDVRAVFAVPLAGLSGEAVGSLAVYFSSPHRPTRPQQSLVARYTRQAGQAVANALRYAAALDALRSTPTTGRDLSEVCEVRGAGENGR